MKPHTSLFLSALLLSVAGCSPTPPEPGPSPTFPAAPPELQTLTAESASNFAQITLKCVQKEYPNQPGLILNAEADVQAPSRAHPAFYGCYDWHSSVHGHWMLARLLRMFPSLPERDRIVKALDANLTARNIQIEAAYFKKPGTQAFERMYGWAWILKFAEELHRGTSPEAKRWEQNLQPLTDALVQRYLDFLPKQTYAIRTGVHPNTAFGLAFALDYANAAGHQALKDLLIKRSLDYFGNDVDYPAKLEPNGADFLSPALIEADLMRRVLAPADFATWFRAYLPGMARGEPEEPAGAGGGHRSFRSAARSSRRAEPEPCLVHAPHCRGAAGRRPVTRAPRGGRLHACRRRTEERRHRPLRRRALARLVCRLPAD